MFKRGYSSLHINEKILVTLGSAVTFSNSTGQFLASRENADV
ncbi:MAG: hypothetical protein ACI9W6_000204 [Motiliproteus sp.]|jgi:hypothetical protein